MAKATKGQGTMNIKSVRTCACFNLRKAARAVTQLYDEVLAPSGLRGTQFSVLAVISAAGAATMTDPRHGLQPARRHGFLVAGATCAGLFQNACGSVRRVFHRLNTCATTANRLNS